MSPAPGAAHLGDMADTDSPSSHGFILTVLSEPVHGLMLPYRVRISPGGATMASGEIFLRVEYLGHYAEEDEWTDTGAAHYESDAVLRSALLDSGLATFAFSPSDLHLRRTAKFVDMWNALFADLPGQRTLKHAPARS